MAKHNYKRGFSAVMAVALVAAAALSMRQGTGVETVSGATEEAGADFPVAGPPSLAELRHFDVYSRYRMMFDDASDYVQGSALDGITDIHPAVMTFSGMGHGTAMAACIIGTKND